MLFNLTSLPTLNINLQTQNQLNIGIIFNTANVMYNSGHFCVLDFRVVPRSALVLKPTCFHIMSS